MKPEDVRKEYTRRAKKEIEAFNEPLKSRIKEAIKNLPEGDVKRLSATRKLYRLRVGDYRVIFEKITKEKIIVSGIAPRGQVYKGV